jgi:hypothetical protein
LKKHRQLHHQSVEKKKISGPSTFSSAEDGCPDKASAIAGNVDDPESHPTEGELKHLHSNRQKGKDNRAHIPSTWDAMEAGAVLGLTMEEAKDHLRIAAKLGGETYTVAEDGDEAKGSRRHHRQGKNEPYPT